MGATEHERRRQDHRNLERELASPPYYELLATIRDRHPGLDLASWHEVIALLVSTPLRDAATDPALVSILEARARDLDPRWTSVLLGIFWCDLERIMKRRASWDADPATLWTNLQWCFLKACSKPQLASRAQRVGAKILNDTLHYLYDEYSADWRRSRLLVSLDPNVVDEEHRGERPVEFEVRDHIRWRTQILSRLRRLVAAGQLTEVEYSLLVATRVGGHSLVEYAPVVGLGYDAAKKCRLRAERRVRALLGDLF